MPCSTSACRRARALTRDEALAELVRRYFTSHGPATVQRFVVVVGPDRCGREGGLRDAGGRSRSRRRRRQALLAGAVENAAEGGGPVAHLLPNYDELLVAYKDHGASVDPALTRGLGPRDAVFANHLVVIDGVVVGGWRRIPDKRGMVVAPTLLRALSAGEKAALARACEA